MKTKEEIYREYSDNPIAWMEKHNCDTTKKVTLELMAQYAKQFAIESNIPSPPKTEK